MPRNYKNHSPTAFQRRPHLARDDEWIRAFIQEAKVGHVATSLDDQPFLTPTTFWYDEENHQIVFHSNVVGRIRSIIEANSKVCMEASELGKLLPSNVALEFSLQFRSVVVFGTARIINDPGEARKMLYGLISKYFPKMTAGREYREITDKELRATSVYAIKIEAWSGKENWDERAEQSDQWPTLDKEWFK
jgi:nitroimidazol reductase NimA-like FMN-containing flavoprotein (pyridoxamine 5'-phosphate oxidase superfamily)